MPRAYARSPAKMSLVQPRAVLAAAALACAAALAGGAVPARAQDMGQVEARRLTIFLDCGFCHETFVRQEMSYVDYVRDREAADVHVLVTEQNTAAGGEAQTLDLIGQGVFDGMNYSAVYTTSGDATQAEERDGFLRTLQASLVPYLLQTSVRERLRITVAEPEEGATGQIVRDDPWNSWTIELYTDASADFESRQRSFDTRYGIYVDRVTADWKIQLRPFFNYDYVHFERDEEVITSTSRRDGFTSYVVRSISPHWSVGAFGDVFTSTFDNVDVRYRLMPAIEYNLYPYSEATRRQLTFAYRVGASHITYRDTTIYDKTRQLLPEHSLTAGYEVTQPWGEIDVGMNASQYLHDLERYSIDFGGDVEVRIVQGLSVEIGGDFAFIRNQLNLRKGEAELEEVLLRRHQLETDYQAGLTFGFRYRFGSIFNNVVNTRFGGGPSQDHF